MKPTPKLVWPAFRLPYDVERGTANPRNRKSRIGYRWHPAYSVAFSDGSQIQAMRLCELRDLARTDGAKLEIHKSEQSARNYWNA